MGEGDNGKFDKGFCLKRLTELNHELCDHMILYHQNRQQDPIKSQSLKKVISPLNDSKHYRCACGYLFIEQKDLQMDTRCAICGCKPLEYICED